MLYSEQDHDQQGDAVKNIYDIDRDDLGFMTNREKAEALGITMPGEVPEADPEEHLISALPYDDVGPVDSKRVSQQPPVPGWIEVKLDEVARSRGIVNVKGAFRGKVSISAIVRGTSLATTTILPLLKKDPNTQMIHVDTISRLCAFLKCTPGDLLQYHATPRPLTGTWTRPGKRRGKQLATTPQSIR